MDGIHLRVPAAFLRDKRIKANQRGIALAVLGAMWSFTGRGNICYASIGLGPDDEDEKKSKIKKATLCSRAALSKNTVVKYKKLLMQLGWITVKREGRGLNDTITLHEIAQVQTRNQNPTNCDPEDKNTGVEVFQNPTTNGCETSGVHQDMRSHVQNCTDTIKTIDEWNKFMDWSKERITLTSYKTLENTEVSLNSNQLLVYSPVSESLSIIISKYFSEEIENKIDVKFCGVGDVKNVA
ncbi:DNA-binding helix-turn-helix protein [Leptospira kirschneri]|uniref:helix-turn-helix domain-containing protein n=1 Tax=Leptospira kirschneri TaxID=29507 RepID=UPI0002BEB257|nr:helix-turn-helix domain-containing protein [Leptospira kirschneri]EMK02919.1 DNA-binding helix-turn-helix protein [Leptospira kirschneri]